MRPVDLRLRNFRSYFGDEAGFDFRDRRLVGIVGPNGSGKSTILDAIAFALYGRTASLGRNTKALIHQRADHGAVAFRFEVDGELWEAQRMLRRKGAGDHALYRLKDDSEGAEKLEQITGDADVTSRIAELLGLDFDAFGRSVLLAQGRFAEFLTAPPAERDKVLKGVFGLDRIDRMRALAKERAREAEVEAEKATVSVQHLAQLEVETEARRSALAADADRLSVLEEAEPKVKELTTAIATTEEEASAAEKQLSELRGALEAFPSETDLEQTLAAARSAAEQRATTAERLEQARHQLKEADERSAAAAAIRDQVAAATALMAAGDERDAAVREADAALARSRDRLQQATAEVAGQADRVTLAERDARTAAQRAEETAQSLAAAEESLHEATHADMASALRRELREGDRCPVCEQTVDPVPPITAGIDLEQARTALDSARRDRSEAEEAHTTASGSLESARTALREAERRAADAADSLAEVEDRITQATEAAADTRTALVELLGSEEVEPVLTAMREELVAAGAALDAATAARDRAIADNDAAIAAEQAAAKRLGDLRVALTGVASRIADAPAFGDDAASIAEAADTLRTLADRLVREATERRDEATSAAEDQAKTLAATMDELGVTGSFDEALGGLRSRVAVLREEVERAEQQLEGMAEQVARRDAHVAAMQTHKVLAADLTDARFVRFLLDDERRRLAELGSEHFQLLTNGRYRFTEDGAFEIVDLTAADAIRKADSLSGGETFLASLALALALAEIVARGGGRLDAFFLDEGFGTLDPEHLDLAMSGIESLVSEDGNRLVVVVSHVPELRHRIEDLIELDRSPTTGDTRVLSG